MGAQVIVQSRIPFSSPLPSVKGLFTRRAVGSQDVNKMESSSAYKDNLPARLAINYLSGNLQATTGMKSSKSGYESLVEAAEMASRNLNPLEQNQLVAGILHNALPSPILSLLRKLVPQSKFSRECFAAVTSLFFAWLIGPSKVKESELNGKIEKNVVYIKKCRFLEESYCVGMCINLCKVPTQMFIREDLGMPVTMNPNFDDMSCEMIYGQIPPLPSDDPVIRQPCYKLCKAKEKHIISCSEEISKDI